MRSLLPVLFALFSSIAMVSRVCGDPAPTSPIGRWASVWQDDGLVIRVVFVFSKDGRFEARSERTATPRTARCGTNVITGIWTLSDGLVTVTPQAFDPPAEAAKGSIVIDLSEVSGAEMTIRDPNSGRVYKLRKEAEPGATDNPDGAQRI